MNMNMNMNVAIYTRLAVPNNDRIAEQEQRVAKFCENRGFHVLKCLSDDGFSGNTLDRPGLRGLLRSAEAGEIEAVVVDDHSRLARDPASLDQLLLTLSKNSVCVIEAKTGEVVGRDDASRTFLRLAQLTQRSKPRRPN